ncbi:MAG: hypothetical protein M5R40_02490 [Anaerolineae bacterium]|nr:hypothetical protein [Anaerolineae bacterium]
MVRRFMGLVLIAAVLMPIALGVASYWVGRQILDDVRVAANVPLSNIEDSIETMKGTLDEASAAFANFGVHVTAVTNAVNAVRNFINSIAASVDLANYIPDFPDNLSVPGLSDIENAITDWLEDFRDAVNTNPFYLPIRGVLVPILDDAIDAVGDIRTRIDFTDFQIDQTLLQIPGLSQVNSAITAISNAFDQLVAVVNAVASIATLPGELNDIARHVTTLTNSLRRVGAQWVEMLTLLVTVFLVWLAVVYVALVYRWVSQGWAMLMGRPT